MKIIDLTNKTFGKLKVKYRSGTKWGQKTWFCECQCGNTTILGTDNLTRGKTKSCGCGHYLKGKNNPKSKGYEDISGTYWSHIKRGAQTRQIIFNISIEYAWDLFLLQNKKCKLSDLDINFKTSYEIQKQGIYGTASLDRINPELGYIEGNVQWVHKDINRMKQNFKENRFVELCRLIIKKNDH